MKTAGTKFYTFTQNNTGGFFKSKEGKFGYALVVEATCARKANGKARALGLYFDGVRSGIDCECCGDRWSKVSIEDGQTEPCYYSTPIKEAAADTRPLGRWWNLPIYVHYLNGRVEKYTYGKAEPLLVQEAR